MLVCDLRVDDRRVPALEELRLPAVVIGGPAPTGTVAQEMGLAVPGDLSGETVGAFRDETAHLTPRGSTAPPRSGGRVR